MSLSPFVPMPRRVEWPPSAIFLAALRVLSLFILLAGPGDFPLLTAAARSPAAEGGGTQA